MIRIATIVLLVLLSGMTGGLFLVKHKVQSLETRVAAAERTVLFYRSNVRTLQAEWTRLTSARHLALLPTPGRLAPLTGGQFRRFSDLPDSFAIRYAAIDEDRAADSGIGSAVRPRKRR